MPTSGQIVEALGINIDLTLDSPSAASRCPPGPGPSSNTKAAWGLRWLSGTTSAGEPRRTASPGTARAIPVSPSYLGSETSAGKSMAGGAPTAPAASSSASLSPPPAIAAASGQQPSSASPLTLSAAITSPEPEVTLEQTEVLSRDREPLLGEGYPCPAPFSRQEHDWLIQCGRAPSGRDKQGWLARRRSGAGSLYSQTQVDSSLSFSDPLKLFL